MEKAQSYIKVNFTGDRSKDVSLEICNMDSPDVMAVLGLAMIKHADDSHFTPEIFKTMMTGMPEFYKQRLIEEGKLKEEPSKETGTPTDALMASILLDMLLGDN